MCPLKREQATRVSYNTLTHSRLYCRDREKKCHELMLVLPFSCLVNNKTVGTDSAKAEQVMSQVRTERTATYTHVSSPPTLHIACSCTCVFIRSQTVTTQNKRNPQSTTVTAAASFACCIGEISRDVRSSSCSRRRSVVHRQINDVRAPASRSATSLSRSPVSDQVLIPEDQR